LDDYRRQKSGLVLEEDDFHGRAGQHSTQEMPYLSGCGVKRVSQNIR